MDGILEKHTNAFSLMVPGVSQIGVLARAGSRAIEAKHLGQWSMTPDGTHPVPYGDYCIS